MSKRNVREAFWECFKLCNVLGLPVKENTCWKTRDLNKIEKIEKILKNRQLYIDWDLEKYDLQARSGSLLILNIALLEHKHTNLFN
jgi:hypothetical protein